MSPVKPVCGCRPSSPRVLLACALCFFLKAACDRARSLLLSMRNVKEARRGLGTGWGPQLRALDVVWFVCSLRLCWGVVLSVAALGPRSSLEAVETGPGNISSVSFVALCGIWALCSRVSTALYATFEKLITACPLFREGSF